uniref:Secreted protein n=1 Tax=Achlya hypogyna TaxID=1202772 RepID=A0A0A7CPD3_ACHHY|nr:secreted protein [Achlya hypogyna]
MPQALWAALPYADLLALLLAAGADANSIAAGENPLHYALNRMHLDSARLLFGQTPLMVAVASCNESNGWDTSLLVQLLDYGADVCPTNTVVADTL